MAQSAVTVAIYSALQKQNYVLCAGKNWNKTFNNTCQSDSLFRSFFVLNATIAQNATPQTAAALCVIWID